MIENVALLILLLFFVACEGTTEADQATMLIDPSEEPTVATRVSNPDVNYPGVNENSLTQVNLEALSNSETIVHANFTSRNGTIRDYRYDYIKRKMFAVVQDTPDDYVIPVDVKEGVAPQDYEEQYSIAMDLTDIEEGEWSTLPMGIYRGGQYIYCDIEVLYENTSSSSNYERGFMEFRIITNLNAPDTYARSVCEKFVETKRYFHGLMDSYEMCDADYDNTNYNHQAFKIGEW